MHNRGFLDLIYSFVLGFAMEVMKLSKGKANPAMVGEVLTRRLKG